MNNTKLYPFERNRYYSGKMLTSADFQAEQTYFNSKRRFINNLMYGAGVVCGYGVFSLDDLSLLIESGVALDGLGREIVMETSVVKKLSAIEGYETLQGSVASLCVRYREEPLHTVYAVSQSASESGTEYEYNRISEGCQLFLMDRDEAAEEYVMEAEFLTSTVIFENENYRISLVMPATVCKGRNVKLEVKVEKTTGQPQKLTYHGTFQIPAFLTPEGEHELEVAVEDAALAEGEVLVREYWMAVQNTDIIDTTVLLKSGSARAWVDGTAAEVISGCSMQVMISACKPEELVCRETGRTSLEMRNMAGVKEYVRLADLRIVRTESAYIIEEVIERDVKNYITAPAQENLRNSYLEYFLKETDISRSVFGKTGKQEKESSPQQAPKVPEIATGTLEISLGESARKGDVRFSAEITHGLGKGNVYVSIGCEAIEEDPALQGSSRNTIYGNPELFRKEKNTMVDAETAVKVYNDKGSFMVAARLNEKVDCLVLTYRWVAIKFPAAEELELENKYHDKSISTDTPTVVMGSGDSHYFHVKFHNMPACSVGYELTEPGSGEISQEGVYTAPNREGVYEIRIYCIDLPVICTYAYAIVKKKGYEE